jgi:hypothetical protein
MRVQDIQMGQTAQASAKWKLQQSKEAWELQKKSADMSGKLATQFLSQWGTSMGSLEGMYGKAFDSLAAVTKNIQGGTGGQFGALMDLTTQMDEQYQEFKQTYDPAAQEFLAGAREEAGLRRGMAQKITELGKTDYEGAMGRAAADVTQQSEIARQAQAREALSYGIDPGSGRFGALSRQSALGEARNKALAMNVARRGEKERLTAMAYKGMEVLDPSKQGQLALGFAKAGTEMLGAKAGIAKAAADVSTAQTRAVTDIAKTTGSLASSFGQQVTQPYGEMAGYFLGKSGGSNVDFTPTISSPGAIPVKR